MFSFTNPIATNFIHESLVGIYRLNLEKKKIVTSWSLFAFSSTLLISSFSRSSPVLLFSRSLTVQSHCISSFFLSSSFSSRYCSLIVPYACISPLSLSLSLSSLPPSFAALFFVPSNLSLFPVLSLTIFLPTSAYVPPPFFGSCLSFAVFFLSLSFSFLLLLSTRFLISLHRVLLLSLLQFFSLLHSSTASLSALSCTLFLATPLLFPSRSFSLATTLNPFFLSLPSFLLLYSVSPSPSHSSFFSFFAAISPSSISFSFFFLPLRDSAPPFPSSPLIIFTAAP